MNELVDALRKHATWLVACGTDPNDGRTIESAWVRDKYKGSIRYSYNRRKWMYWTGKCWCYDESGEIKKLADVVIADLKREAFQIEDEKEREAKLRFASKTANSAGKCNMITEAQHLDGVPVMVNELDAYTDFLNCQNGIVNLRNGELIPHEVTKNLDGWQVWYPNKENCVCDAIEHCGSYGAEDDLLEIMGLLTEEERSYDSVKGYMTAEEVFERIKAHFEGRFE